MNPTIFPSIYEENSRVDWLFNLGMINVDKVENLERDGHPLPKIRYIGNPLRLHMVKGPEDDIMISSIIIEYELFAN